MKQFKVAVGISKVYAVSPEKFLSATGNRAPYRQKKGKNTSFFANLIHLPQPRAKRNGRLLDVVKMKFK